MVQVARYHCLLHSTRMSGINVQGAGSTTTTLNVIGVSTFANSVVVGGATTTLLVNGDTRIVGILTVGAASVTFSGVNNRIAGVTTFTDPSIFESSIDVDGHTELDNVNVSGVLTATSFSGDGSGLSGVSGYNDLDNALFG